jgi:broad specificity phosphatase PhoE
MCYVSDMSTRRVFLARHGNRQDFVDPTWPSTADEPYDPPLSADGIEQARRLGQRLRGEGIGAIVSSPFLRTVQTAHFANLALDVPIYIEPGFGEWLEASSFDRLPRLRTLDVLRAEYPTLADGYAAHWVQRHPETAAQLRERTQQTLTKLLHQLDGTLLVVSHAASVGAMALIDERLAHIDCPLCALFMLEHDAQGWRLLVNADITHVGESLAVCRFP